MQRTIFALLLWGLVFSGHLNAQDVELRPSLQPNAETAEQVDPPGNVLSLRSTEQDEACLLYTSPSPRDQRGSRMPSSA